MYKHPLLDRDKITPKEAIDILKEGNIRFINQDTEEKDLKR